LTGTTQANVSLSSDESWVSLSGIARLVENRRKVEELWNPMISAWFPGGPEDPDVGVLKFIAESAKYWDSPGRVAAAVQLRKARLTGERADVGERGKVALCDSPAQTQRHVSGLMSPESGRFTRGYPQSRAGAAPGSPSRADRRAAVGRPAAP